MLLLLQLLCEDVVVHGIWYTGDFEMTYRDLIEGCTRILNGSRTRNVLF